MHGIENEVLIRNLLAMWGELYKYIVHISFRGTGPSNMHRSSITITMTAVTGPSVYFLIFSSESQVSKAESVVGHSSSGDIVNTMLGYN